MKTPTVSNPSVASDLSDKAGATLLKNYEASHKNINKATKQAIISSVLVPSSVAEQVEQESHMKSR